MQSFSGTAVTVSLHLDTSDSHMYVFSWFTKIKYLSVFCLHFNEILLKEKTGIFLKSMMLIHMYLVAY